MQPIATRAELTAMADRLERGSADERTQAVALRARLREGDFRAGDRLLLIVEGSVPLRDTLAVASGPKVSVPEIGDVPLAGVLRSELPAHMRTQLAKFVRDARVQSTALVRVAVVGPVARPGIHYLPPETPIGDAVMRAGGPAGNADLNRTIVRRNSTELYDSRNTRTAIADGLTLDQLSLRSGDEIVVGTQRQRSWATVAQVVSVVTSLALAISYGLSR